ncbi:hypothetical protein TraAM80_03491 [Trypanosoma rangeli]|uniref:Uncharacterized protein n=1 Tax=Trypanosoma rangeli TaxID=5698 RepID=A0A3R7NSV5_TRYRA|nr:uncharacterized protein TraAM80_03491 [Trypanosoma rangeli]RNF07139.1 hypothetical protein TraAM80_03491 [Trypanosoma rangeli]|eukprot:RNF07139.1 hypothetical protein TraAM80_03491 [Trypanosoma rangeli]
MRSFFNTAVNAKDAHSLNMMRKSLENIRAQRAMEKMKETVLNNSGRAEDPLNVGDMGHYAAGDDGAAFDPAAAEENTPAAKRKREKAAYQEAPRRRHGVKAHPFGDEDLRGLWDQH